MVKTRAVIGQLIVFEGYIQKIRCARGAWRIERPAFEPMCQCRYSPRAHPAQGVHLDSPHRAAEHNRLHWQPLMQCAQADAPAHRMGQKAPGFGQRKCGHRRNQSRTILLVLGKICDMAFQPVGQRAVCKTLTPPVYRHSMIIPRGKVGRNTGVFFNVFGAPRENYDRSLGGLCPPQTQPAAPFVTCVYPKCLPVRWWRVRAQRLWVFKIRCGCKLH